MAKREILVGATDQTVDIFVNDSSSTTGGGLTGLVFNTASLTCYYRKGATGAATALTLATQTVAGAHSDGGFKEIDATNMPGAYRLDLSDTMVAAAGMLTVYLRGATNMVPCVLEIEVVNVNKFDGVRMGLTALPNAAAEAAGGLYTRGTGAGQINQPANGLVDVNVENWNTTAVPAEHTAGYPIVTVKDGTGTGEINTNAGAIALVDLVTTTTTATTATNVTTVNGLAAGVITAASIAADAITAAKIADGAIDAGALAADCITAAKIAADVSTEIRSLASGTSDSGTTTTMVDAARTEADDDYWKGMLIVFTSGTIAGQARIITGFTASSDTITFAPATTQTVGTQTYEIWPVGDFLRPTTSGRTLDVTTGGNAGIDWANVEAPTTTVGLSGTTVGVVTLVNTLTTYTGNTVQTGDSYAIVNSGTHGNAAIKGFVDDIGTAGAGLTAVPWNAAWDTEVQSEVQDAIEVNQLDHLIQVADPGSIVANSSLWAALTSKSATPAYSSYVNTTDSLEAQRDNIGTTGGALSLAKTTNITGFNDLSAAQVNTEADTALSDVGVTTTVTGRIDRAISAILTTAMTEAYNADGVAPTPAQALFVIMQRLTEFAISGTTITAKKIDGSTTAFTLTLDSATTPTSSTRAT